MRRRKRDKRRTAPPPVTQWTPVVDMLAQTVDAINRTNATLVWAHSANHTRPEVKPVLRPVTAIAHAERKAKEARAEGLFAQLVPNSGG